MPIEIVQSNSGGFNTSSGSATLGASTTTGNTLLIWAFAYGGGTITTAPSGTTKISPSTVTTQKMSVWYKVITGAETSWTITMTGAQPCTWAVYELSGVDVDASPVDASSAWTTATAATASTGTSGTSTAYDGVAIGGVMARDAASGTGPTWTGHTNGFTELHDQAQAIAAGTSAIGMSTAWKPVSSIGTWEFTATHSLSPSTAVVGGWMVVLAAQDSRRDVNLAVMAGFEWGTTAGLTTGLTSNYLFGASAGSPDIVTSTPRTGTYCLECSASAAAEYVGWDITHFGTPKTVLVLRLCVYFPSTLPAGNVELATLTASEKTVVRFVNATDQIGVKVGGGAEQLSAATVAADTWYGIDLRVDTTTTAATADWQLDGVDQTQATDTVIAGANTTVTVGWETAATATVRFDDVALSNIGGNYPIGDLKIVKLEVDAADTVTISGTAANFSTFTANGTLAAWNATTARGAISEVPPIIGASADGVAQDTLAASDYINIPMETYNASGVAAVRSTRVYVCGWAASGTAATIGVFGWDGSTEATLFAVADPAFDNSTTTPAWIAKMWKPATGWTQAKLDAAAVRLGKSGDATPVIGAHAVLMEAAVQMAPVTMLFGTADADLRVEQALDPVTQGIIGLIVTNLTGADATLIYEISGVEQTPVTVTDGTDGDLIALDAPDMPTISRVTMVAGEGI